MEKILSKYQEAATLSPDILTAFINQALCYNALGKYSSALEVLDTAEKHASMNDEKSLVALYKGYTLEYSGKKKEAQKYYDKALDYDLKEYAKVKPITVERWEKLLAAKGLDEASAFLKKTIATENLDEQEKTMLQGLAEKPQAKVMGRDWYIWSKASGIKVVSKEELENMKKSGFSKH